MILKNDQTIVIVTPTKTGTFSLESCFRTQSDYSIIKPRHRHTLPDYSAWPEAVVIIPIRHPFARIFSAYMWTRGNYSRIWHDAVNFEEFCVRWRDAFDNKRNHDWTWRYCDYVNYHAERGRSVELFKLERNGVAQILDRCNVDVAPRHINKTSKDVPREQRPHWRDHFNMNCYRLLLDPLQPDLDLGAYDA